MTHKIVVDCTETLQHHKNGEPKRLHRQQQKGPCSLLEPNNSPNCITLLLDQAIPEAGEMLFKQNRSVIMEFTTVSQVIVYSGDRGYCSIQLYVMMCPILPSTV